MSALLPISQEDLATCEERWGWNYLPGVECAGSFCATCNDEHNAVAILDRERVLRLKGLMLDFDSMHGLIGNRTVRSYSPTGVLLARIHCGDQFNAPNFRSWLLVELTKQLPPEVWG